LKLSGEQSEEASAKATVLEEKLEDARSQLSHSFKRSFTLKRSMSIRRDSEVKRGSFRRPSVKPSLFIEPDGQDWLRQNEI